MTDLVTLTRMRVLLATTFALAMLAVAPLSAGASARSAAKCASFKVAGEYSGSRSFSKLRTTRTTCKEGRRIARLWLSNLSSGTRKQMRCAPGQGVSSASCAVGAYTCTARAETNAPANDVSCRSGSRRISWRTYFEN